MLWCMAIFWRALDWRSYKEIGEVDVEHRSEKEYTIEYPFDRSHRAWMAAAQDAAADSMLYLSHTGWEQLASDSSADMEDGICSWSRWPKNIPDLDTKGVPAALKWIPLRLRWSIARVLHFALALYVECLHMQHVHKQIRTKYLAYWLVEDIRHFFDDRMASIMEHWLKQIQTRWDAGDKVEFIDCLYMKNGRFVDLSRTNKTEGSIHLPWSPKPLSSACNHVFSRRARLFDYSSLAVTCNEHKMHEDNPTFVVEGMQRPHRIAINDESPSSETQVRDILLDTR